MKQLKEVNMVSNKKEIPEKIKNVLEIIVERYKADKNCTGIVLFGSFATGNYNDFSDVDIMILNKHFLYKKFLISIQNIFIDILFTTKEFFLKEFCKNKGKNCFKDSRFIILYDKDGETKKIIYKAKRKIKKIPVALSDEEKEEIKLFLKFFLHKLNSIKNNKLNILYLSTMYLNYALEKYFEINRLWCPNNDKLINYLSKHNLHLYKYVSKFLKTNGAKKRLNLLKRIFALVLDNIEKKT